MKTKHIEKIKSTQNVEWLKKQLLKSYETNDRLHRRLQKCEGADIRLVQLLEFKDSILKSLVATNQENIKLYKELLTEAGHKYYAIPSIVRWLFERK